MLTLFICILVSVDLISSQCQWTVSTPNGNKSLNLTALQYEVLTAKDNTYKYDNYSYSICNNSLMCYGFYHMVSMIQEDNNVCIDIAEFDSSILPKYSNEKGGIWQFDYIGAYDCFPVLTHWQPTFICDPSVKYQTGIVERIVNPNTCDFSVNISTMYACQQSAV